ncbi:hypothetical protein BU17DRAFT_76473 [Hysterangium stoloniferum]|nr:hypothetical protein BU17DRAFT_76473 [Hysterangium stoloniferum]
MEFIRQSGISISSDTGEFNKIGKFKPVDATTNPSLVFAAVTNPEYAHILDSAIEQTMQRHAPASVEEKIEAALDLLLVKVGVQILRFISGRVSVSVDPRLADDYNAIVRKGKNIISLFEELGIPRARILIKIPATYSGILAARTLESPSDPSALPIHTNLTLIFSLVQALACAQAGATAVSPFIGRVKDWWAAQDINTNYTALPLSHHPGILLVQRIRAAYATYGHKSDIVAAGFRHANEVVELARGGRTNGPDFFTLAPDMLEALSIFEVPGNFALERKGVQATTVPEPVYISRRHDIADSEAEAAYMKDLAAERIALDKVPEGLDKFSLDAKKLEDIVRSKFRAPVEVSAML